MEWNISYLEPAERWLNQLETIQLKSVAKELKLLELLGNHLKLPHSKSLGNGLFELRERKFGLRLYYFFDKGQLILLSNGGGKKTQTKDIKQARLLLAEYRRMGNEGKKL